PWLELVSEMKIAGQVLQEIDIPVLKAVGKALDIISGLLGTSANTGSSTMVVTSQNTITVTTSSTTMAITNPAGGGPGHADKVYAMINARVCWYTNGGPIKLALIGWDSVATLTADLLSKPDGSTGLSDDTRAALLTLDPFASDPSVVPPSPRFVRLPGIDV